MTAPYASGMRTNIAKASGRGDRRVKSTRLGPITPEAPTAPKKSVIAGTRQLTGIQSRTIM